MHLQSRHRYRETEKQRYSETERHKDIEKQTKRKRKSKGKRKRTKEREGYAHTHTYKHTHKQLRTIDDRAHILISQCPLELDKVKGHTFMFIRLRCLEILPCSSPPASARFPARPPRPQTALGIVPILHTHPVLSTSTLSFPLPFLLSCP